jgi:hypothetical protein
MFAVEAIMFAVEAIMFAFQAIMFSYVEQHVTDIVFLLFEPCLKQY